MSTAEKIHFPESELIITEKGNIYHLDVNKDMLAETILLVGDQGRVEQISKFFSKIEHKVQHREFVTHTGIFNGKRVSAISTGIGTDNVDIVINEIDACFNIDFKKRELVDTPTKLNIVRLGTSGALQADIPVNGLVVSEYGLGMDGLLNYYDNFMSVCDDDLAQAFMKHTSWTPNLPYPYIVKGNTELYNMLVKDNFGGITATAPGFYGPQGRRLRLKPAKENMNELLTAFSHNGKRITNFEMETSALYGLGAMMGHNCATACVIIANRIRKEFTNDYKASVKHLIESCLERLTA